MAPNSPYMGMSLTIGLRVHDLSALATFSLKPTYSSHLDLSACHLA